MTPEEIQPPAPDPLDIIERLTLLTELRYPYLAAVLKRKPKRKWFTIRKLAE